MLTTTTTPTHDLSHLQKRIRAARYWLANATAGDRIDEMNRDILLELFRDADAAIEEVK